ncbi:holin [Streptomyces sp. Z26]|uniref:holin n=1 Tax=Streptomyces sp. Z26 TaxID=2500177 RepID=UPI000EF16B0E|nr:holin [Streptomyces sp. Z26]RLL68123.1 holin [Streptomyces sp. Z26]
MSEPIETKVKASTAAAYLGSTGLLAMLTAVQDNAGLVSSLPDVLEPFVLALVPAAITGVAGWGAKHTPRRTRGV